MRALSGLPESGVIPADREVRSVAWIDAPNVTPGWYVSSSGPCALTVDLGNLTVPAIELQEEPDLGGAGTAVVGDRAELQLGG